LVVLPAYKSKKGAPEEREESAPKKIENQEKLPPLPLFDGGNHPSNRSMTIIITSRVQGQ
jgi:hypothetical protein